MFFFEYKFQTQKGEESALQNSGDICQRCFEVMLHPFQSHMGATTLGSCSPRLAQTWCSSFEQSSLLHKPKTLPQTGVLATPGDDVLCDLRLSPVFFFLGFFSHLFGLWVSQGRGSSPEPVECSPQRLSTARKNCWSGEGATASPVRKKTTYFPLEKKTPQHQRILIVFK